jgi:hypothetical protein
VGSQVGDCRGIQRDTDRPGRARIHQKVRLVAGAAPGNIWPKPDDTQALLHCAMAFQGQRYIAIRVGDSGSGVLQRDCRCRVGAVARGAVAARGLAVRMAAEPVLVGDSFRGAPRRLLITRERKHEMPSNTTPDLSNFGADSQAALTAADNLLTFIETYSPTVPGIATYASAVSLLEQAITGSVNLYNA